MGKKLGCHSMKTFMRVLLLFVEFAAFALCSGGPLDSFLPPEGGYVTNSSLGDGFGVNTADECAQSCLDKGTMCVSFSLIPELAPADMAALCGLNRYGPKYTVIPPTQYPKSQYYLRVIPRNDDPVTPAVKYLLEVPTSGVDLHGGGFLRSIFDNNIAYLLIHPVDDLLFFYRMRAGNPNPPGECWGWDQNLKGSVSGLFMMGSGGTLRWPSPNATLQDALNAVIDGIGECAEPNGFIMAYPENETSCHENPDYVLSWVTHGLLESSIAGNSKALPLARGQLDWFNYNKYLPEFMPPDDDPNDVPPLYGAAQGHQIYLIYQGIIHSTRMALSPVGRKRDVELVQELYQEDWWLAQLADRNPDAVWQRHWFPHNYEMTGIEAYMDMYVLTGNKTYLDAVQGAWELFMAHWIHVGGSMAINEMPPGSYPPGSYYLDFQDRYHDLDNKCGGPSNHDHLHHRHSIPGAEVSDDTPHPTGELCGSVFWTKFNQRLHRVFPDEEKYVTEIERSIINVGAANQGDPPQAGIRYFALLHKQKQYPTVAATCCEGQGTRLFGSLPEYLYSISADGIYIDFYAPSTIVWNNGINLTCVTTFPYSGEVSCSIVAPDSVTFTVSLRMPSWAAADVPISVDGENVGTGKAGSYFKLKRTWSKTPSTIQFTLPMAFRVTKYTGLTQIQSYSRYALEYGPTLLSVTGPWDNSTDCLILSGVDPQHPEDWLVPVSGKPLHFSVKGDPQYEYLPYFEIQDDTMFTVYPIINDE